MTDNVLAVVAAMRRALVTAPGQRVYGVVDAATCVDLAYEAKVQFGKEIRSLFLPEVEGGLWDVAPYLVPIDVDSGYFENWARRWGTHAGILLATAAEADTLYEHLRKIFIVEDEDGQQYFFRFYDPRVLRAFLPTCTQDQLEDLMGPINRLMCESGDRRRVLLCQRMDGGIAQMDGCIDTNEPYMRIR